MRRISPRKRPFDIQIPEQQTSSEKRSTRRENFALKYPPARNGTKIISPGHLRKHSEPGEGPQLVPQSLSPSVPVPYSPLPALRPPSLCPYVPRPRPCHPSSENLSSAFAHNYRPPAHTLREGQKTSPGATAMMSTPSTRPSTARVVFNVVSPRIKKCKNIPKSASNSHVFSSLGPKHLPMPLPVENPRSTPVRSENKGVADRRGFKNGPETAPKRPQNSRFCLKIPSFSSILTIFCPGHFRPATARRSDC